MIWLVIDPRNGKTLFTYDYDPSDDYPWATIYSRPSPNPNNFEGLRPQNLFTSLFTYIGVHMRTSCESGKTIGIAYDVWVVAKMEDCEGRSYTIDHVLIHEPVIEYDWWFKVVREKAVDIDMDGKKISMLLSREFGPKPIILYFNSLGG